MSGVGPGRRVPLGPEAGSRPQLAEEGWFARVVGKRRYKSNLSYSESCFICSRMLLTAALEKNEIN